MADCEYPPCTEPATQSRAMVFQPEPIWIDLCEQHAAVIDRNRNDEEHDFWRWASAMMGTPRMPTDAPYVDPPIKARQVLDSEGEPLVLLSRRGPDGHEPVRVIREKDIAQALSELSEVGEFDISPLAHRIIGFSSDGGIRVAKALELIQRAVVERSR